MSHPKTVIVVHFWGNKYPPTYVHKLYFGLRRHLRQPHRFVIVTDQPEKFREWTTIRLIDLDLASMPGCVCRLRMFDPAWQRSNGIQDGDRVISLDIDVIVTGGLDPLFDGRNESFVILQGVNTSNPCPYNGSIFMFKAGAHADVWNSFSPDALSKIPYHAFPDDQGWFHHKIPDARAWTSNDGVYAFKKRGWPSGDSLPANARLVTFPGWRDPSMFSLSWIKEHWRP